MCSYDYDQNSHRLTIHVPEAAVNSFNKLCRERKLGKAIHNLSRLYFLLRWMNEHRLSHIDMESIAAITFSHHYERAQKAIAILRDMGLLITTQSYNSRSYRTFYHYYTRELKFEGGAGNETVVYNYIPTWQLALLMSRKFPPPTSTGIHQTSLPSDNSLATNVSETPMDEFAETFTSWYDDLLFDGQFHLPGHFSEKDGRFYHKFHSYCKEQREAFITWDGERIVEVWDAHSAFFIVLGYYLRDIKQYADEADEQEFRGEAARLLALALDDRLYVDIQRYHNERADIKFNRDEAKREVQKYKNYSRSSLFRKDGNLKMCFWCERVRFIDRYFKENFPAIRDLFLDYPRHEEIDERHWHLKNNEWVPGIRKVSNLQHDIMPYEFQLFSLGICRDLWERFGVKSVTVHDAIYMKVSDAKKRIDIDALLARRLGMVMDSSKGVALF